MTSSAASSLPIVLLPIGTDDDALDACLGALDAGTPEGARLWLADDAQAGPRGLAIIERWLTRTHLQAASIWSMCATSPSMRGRRV